jgi:hypothetical protein
MRARVVLNLSHRCRVPSTWELEVSWKYPDPEARGR